MATSTAADGPVILWFRQDLRIRDNPALEKAFSSGLPVICLYIHDLNLTGRRLGEASLWWLDKSLRALTASLAERGGRLTLRSGDAEAELRRIVEETGAQAVYMNRLFEPVAFARDADIAHGLRVDGVECHGFNGALLARPGSVLNGSGGPYKVFTPFFRQLIGAFDEHSETRGPRDMASTAVVASENLDSWNLHPLRPDWSTGFDWTPGEVGARQALSRFIADGLRDYARGRDHPAQPHCSRLSPHLHFGEISPREAVRRVRGAAADGRVPGAEAEKFVSEVGWREFSAHLLHHFPTLPERAFRPEYDAFPWRDDEAGFRAWTLGQTGYPIVDAGMRQLWTTGWMHNRVRMIVASFLIKDLLIDWRRGEAWFWDTLVDADLASNVQNWQWVAGSGADAAPYFRIFNPVSQGEKFDRDGAYVRQWVPELKALPAKWIHAPWTAPREVLAAAGVRLGHDYPRPIVDHAEARVRALAALKEVSAAKVGDD
ncbi:cryptochrome/photolyase family protein [Brevundimonas sp. VNH65]|uniref:cryptochrome/photolyase family protein n=1 Tax=Brevundimonas sp. VNH65 TaxID=3400917 RepID=UPI003C0D68EF